VSDLYDTDVLTWSERQAELLRRRAAGDLVNEAEIDWPNIAEEIEDVGRSSVRAVRSHLVQALLHDLKIKAWPNSRDVPHWRAEARLHRDEARDDYVASMATKIDMTELYRRARRALPDLMDDQPPMPVPTTGPSLDEMMASTDELGNGRE
jgi:hypothetical protein